MGASLKASEEGADNVEANEPKPTVRELVRRATTKYKFETKEKDVRSVVMQEEHAIGSVPMSVFFKYYAAGGYVFLVLCLGMLAVFMLLYFMVLYWLLLWADADD
jgi:hypothetical protein